MSLQDTPVGVIDDHPHGTQATLSAALAETLPDLPARLSTIRRHLHAHPEVGMQEFETARFIRRTLEEAGFDVHGPLATTGLYVDIEGAHPGPMIAYRADIDALPIQDAKTVAYCSTRAETAHLCGHDAHTAIAIGVALALKARREEMHGRVRVFFQPNEEGMPSGAPLMIRDGVLAGVEAVYAIHVDPTRDVGHYGLSYGAVTAAADSFIIRVNGRGTGHTARPHQTIDVIWVSTQIMSTLYQIVGRINDTRNSAVLAFGRIHAGHALNVLPDHVEFGGTLRCLDADDRVLLRTQIERTAREIAGLYGAGIDFQLMQGAPSVVNDPVLADLVEETGIALRGERAIELIDRSSMGAEDFAHYLEHVPGLLLRVGTGSGPDTCYPLHHARFDVDERALPLAVDLMTQVLLNHLYRKGKDG